MILHYFDLGIHPYKNIYYLILFSKYYLIRLNFYILLEEYIHNYKEKMYIQTELGNILIYKNYIIFLLYNPFFYMKFLFSIFVNYKIGKNNQFEMNGYHPLKLNSHHNYKIKEVHLYSKFRKYNKIHHKMNQKNFLNLNYHLIILHLVNYGKQKSFHVLQLYNFQKI